MKAEAQEGAEPWNSRRERSPEQGSENRREGDDSGTNRQNLVSLAPGR